MIEPRPQFHFELATGNVLTTPDVHMQVTAGEAPRNLGQLHEAGKLIVVESAELKLLPELEVPKLATILDARTYGEIAADAYPHLGVDDWSRGDYLSYGHWVDEITRKEGQPTSNLTQKVLRQAFYLGVGPAEARIARRNRFGSLANYYRALDVTPRHRRNLFDTWSDQDLADYAEKVFLEHLERTGGETGYIDLNDEIDRQAKAGLGPSTEIYRRDGGWPMRYMVLNGYVDVISMQPDDYIQLGVDIMFANNGKLPTPEAFELLVKTRRTPSPSQVMKVFSWTEFRDKIQSQYNTQQLMSLQDKLRAIKKDIVAGNLPPNLLEGMVPEDVPAVHAKWLLVDELLPMLKPSHKLVIAQYVPLSRLKQVLKYTANGYSRVNDESIQLTVEKLGIEQDLWPKPEKPYLIVPEELLRDRKV